MNELTLNFLFYGRVLEEHPEHKFAFKKEIEGLMNQEIVKTESIYTFDPHNATSFHTYIDSIPNIAVVTRTEANFFLGAFSECPLDSTKVASKRGLLMSLTNNKAYSLIEGRRSVTYDPFYFIFGNSEMRFRQNEQKVFCNFGINNGFFKAQGSSPNDLLGAGKEREAKIIGYEVYRVLFK
jgi:hypothetical protein